MRKCEQKMELYEVPAVTVVAVEVEVGFAVSEDWSTTDPNKGGWENDDDD